MGPRSPQPLPGSLCRQTQNTHQQLPCPLSLRNVTDRYSRERYRYSRERLPNRALRRRTKRISARPRARWQQASPYQVDRLELIG